VKNFSYNERDHAFSQAIHMLRTVIGLTQTGLAELLSVSRRTVAEWEAGKRYPRVEHLKCLIDLGVRQQAFSAGQESEQIRMLWKAAHPKILLNEQWLSVLLGQQYVALPVESGLWHVKEVTMRKQAMQRPVAGQRVDWGDALAIPTFYGREQELAVLTQWVVQEGCRVVSILGMGGIGKSVLAVRVMHQVAEDGEKLNPYEVVIFRSLRDAPSCEAFLDDCLRVFSPQPLGAVPADLEQRINLLLEQMGRYRALVVLDNLEAILQEGDVKGSLRPGFEGYGWLLRRVVETEHQSCL
jgi:transcriptional regulator with XRE-family HTH domain